MKITIETKSGEKLKTGLETIKANFLRTATMLSSDPSEVKFVTPAPANVTGPVTPKKTPMKKTAQKIVKASLAIVLLFTLLFASNVTCQAATKKVSALSTTNVVGMNDLLVLTVPDTNAPTGYKSRSITVSNLLNAITNSTFTNYTVVLTTNTYNATNATFSATNVLISLTNGGVAIYGETNTGATDVTGLWITQTNGFTNGIVWNRLGVGAIYTGAKIAVATMGTNYFNVNVRAHFDEEVKVSSFLILTNGADVRFDTTAFTNKFRLVPNDTAVGTARPNIGVMDDAGEFAPLRAGSVLIGTASQTDPPDITTGSGAPSASKPKGSIYLRTGGGNASQVIYVNTNGTTGWKNMVGN